jgi:anti-sigma factor RsiW
MTCQELVELVTDYLEGALEPAELTRFEAHLAVCPGCVTYVEQIRQTIHAVGSLAATEISPTDEARLLRLFRAWRTG